MTTALYFAAFLSVMVGIVHSALGERYLLTRLLKYECFPKIFKKTEFAARTIRFAWHITSIACWGFAAILVQLAQGTVTMHGIAQAIGITFVATGLVTLVGSRAKLRLDCVAQYVDHSAVQHLVAKQRGNEHRGITGRHGKLRSVEDQVSAGHGG